MSSSRRSAWVIRNAHGESWSGYGFEPDHERSVYLHCRDCANEIKKVLDRSFVMYGKLKIIKVELLREPRPRKDTE